MEAITGVFFGDYATAELLDDVKRLLPVITSGLMSLPVRFPWPLNKISLLGYSRSMKAREAFKSIILGILQDRRLDQASKDGGSRGGKSAAFLDALIEVQQQQMGLEDGREQIFGDDFIVDNVRNVHPRS
ncbi:unnamed protein product [Hapterophycus canaliculatus]